MNPKEEIIPIRMMLGSLNCYLIKTGTDFLLVDTGAPSGRKYLQRTLEEHGVRPGNLRLIVLTHGDFDHTGNAAFLRDRFNALIAMHPDDAGMAERADMFWNRENRNWLLARLVPLLFGFTKRARFTPDVLLADGFALQPYGLDACILSLPGHSKGSIGLLTPSGDLFCGDFLMNDKGQPSFGFGKLAGFQPGLRRLRELPIRTIYPGHGGPLLASADVWEGLARLA